MKSQIAGIGSDSKLIYKVACPGYGDIVPMNRRVKGEMVMQIVDCQKCGLSWRRTPGGSDQRITLGAIDPENFIIVAKKPKQN